MSYNGSGTFQINTSGQPVVTGTVISSTAFNALTADLANGLSTAITKDGQTATTVRIPFAQGINSTLATDSTSGSTGSIFTAGGVGITKGLFVGGTATFSASPVFSALTASSAVATDASKNLVSVTNTGTGNNVLATSPTLVTPNITSGLTLTSAAGTSGQVLTSAGSGSAPTWTTPSTATGTVTSVATGTGLTGGPITTTGTIAIDSTVATLAGTQTLTNKTLGSGLVAGASLITSGTAVTLTTQTAIDFASLPSWVKRITVMLADVNMAAANANALIRIGTSGTVATTGYSNNYIQTNGSSTFGILNGTTGFIVGFTSNAANNINAVAVLTLVGSNMWSYSSNSIESGTQRAHISLGSKSLGGTLDILSVVLTSSSYDGGTINILYE